MIDVEAWTDFAVVMGGAAAVLAGLIFIALTMNIDRVLRVRGLPGRAGESVIMFLGALVECAFLLIPHQPAAALGLELLLGGLAQLGVLLAIARHGIRMPNRQPQLWHTYRVAVIVVVSLLTALAGASVLGAFGGGLYWLAASILIALLAASGNAWVLLVEVVRDDRYTPVEEWP